MTMPRSHWLAGITAVASLAGVVHGQAFYGTDQSTACATFPNFANLGCFLGDIRTASGYVFSPMNYDPSDPSNTYPGFWPGNDFNNTVTPVACAKACRGFGFRVAALYNGDCSCGYNDPTGLTLLASCTAACPGDASQTCGGTGATQVYVDPSFADPDAVAGTPQTQLAAYYQRLGCFHISAGQEFPTQNRVNSAFLSSTVLVCLESCALLRYPLAYASYNDASSVNCECGETFAAGVFRVDESTDTTGMCRASCTDGTAGTCDPTTGLCCGSGDYASVYINPELEGCYTPPIPGYGEVGGVNSGPLACASVAASLTGGPSTLTRTVYASATLNPAAPQPTHPLTVVGNSNPDTYYEYGCVAQTIANVAISVGGTAPYTTADIPFTAMSLEACADACPGSVYFAVTDGDTCYCFNGVAQDLAFGDFGNCNTRCTGLASELCGGTNAVEIYAQLSGWNNAVANDISATLLATPIPSIPCTSTGTSTTDSTSSTAATGSTSSTATASSTTSAATSASTSSATDSSSTSSATTATGSSSSTGDSSSGSTATASNSQTGTSSSSGSGVGQSTSSGTGTSTGAGQSTGTGTTSGGGQSTGTGTSAGTGTSTGAGQSTGTGTNSGGGQSTGTDTSTGTGTSTGAGQSTGTGTNSGGGQSTSTGAGNGAGQSTGTGASSGAAGTSTGSGGAGTSTGPGQPTGPGASTGTGQPTGTIPGGGNGSGSTTSSGAGQQTGLPTDGTGNPTRTSASNTASVSPTEPSSATRYIFGVVRIDSDTPVVPKRDTIGRQSVNGGFIGNAGPGREVDAPQKRQAGFVGGAGPVNPTDCRLATPFNFLQGQLSSGGELVSTNPGVPYMPFSTNPAAGSITTEFAISNDVLFWGNAAFTDFYAEYCQDDSGQVWVVFGAAPPPFSCAPVMLVVFDINLCVDGVIVSVGAPGVGTGTGTGVGSGSGLPTGTNTGLLPGTSTGNGAGSGLPTTTGSGLLPGSGAGTGGGGATNSGPAITGSSTGPAGSGNTGVSTALGGSTVVDGTLTIGDHTYTFPAQVTPGDYDCVTENATWVQGDTHPTFVAGVF